MNVSVGLMEGLPFLEVELLGPYVDPSKASMHTGASSLWSACAISLTNMVFPLPMFRLFSQRLRLAGYVNHRVTVVPRRHFSRCEETKIAHYACIGQPLCDQPL